ncbi:MAG TPA: HDOD domain-containing protein [Plasticicumulans sp.]|nr:HDOD domain-containing protein [Plasticicumulans sp.]HNI23179.1 HDOD domain-containing protein [Plasticicumulans sp.]HNK32587.1 HDOD domain-containing protein [Plasticicumulans sp.]
MDRTLETRLRQAGALASLPNVAMRVVALAHDPDVEAEQLLDEIQHDPPMTARVLRAANSVLYNHPRRITNLRQALVVMGTKGITHVALGFSLRGLMQPAGTSPDFWRRSVYAALVGRELAHRLAPLAVEDVFVAALLQDLGILALEQALPADYARIVAGCDGHAARAAAERAALGTDHAEVGAWLLGQWGLPELLIEAVARSHDPRGVAPARRTLVHCVATSGVIADLWLDADHEAATERAWLAGDVWLGLDTEVLSGVLETVDRRLPDMMALFDLEAVDPAQLDAVLAAARELLPHYAVSHGGR